MAERSGGREFEYRYSTGYRRKGFGKVDRGPIIVCSYDDYFSLADGGTDAYNPI
jgi:hypothetical protein